MRILMIVVYVVLILFGVTFAALNASPVQINLYVLSLKMPISVLMVSVLGVGICIGLLLMLFRYWRLKSEYRKIKNQLKITEREIKNLRTIPLRNEDTVF